MTKSRPKPRRRKPNQARSRATVDAIVGAAARVLARRGYAGTTTNHIAAKAGVSIGSFYEYFRDKDAVVRAVLDRHLAEGEALFAARSSAYAQDALTRPLREVLGWLVQAFLDFHADDPRLHRVLSTEVPRSAAIERRVRRLEEQIVDLLAALFAAHPAARARDPRRSAQLCVQVVDALAHRWIIDDAGQPVDAGSLARELTDLLGAYFAP